MSDKGFTVVAIIAVLATLIIGGFQIKGAVECGNKGGAYVIPHNSWPVCLKGIQ